MLVLPAIPDNRNDEAFVAPDIENYWMAPKNHLGTPPCGGVDLYVGGAEHAVLHLLYSRFWHKVLFDLGYLSTAEPFGRCSTRGTSRRTPIRMLAACTSMS